MANKRDIEYPRTAGSVEWDQWIREQSLTNAEAGERVGVSDVTAYHWRIGAKVPRPPNRRAIEFVTRGRDGRRVLPGIRPAAWDEAVEAARRVPRTPWAHHLHPRVASASGGGHRSPERPSHPDAGSRAAVAVRRRPHAGVPVIDISIGVLQEFAELASHEVTDLVDIIRYQAPLPTAADFPALAAEARAYFDAHKHAHREPRRDHSKRLAKLRSITAAKLTTRVCACPCRQTFTPTALGLKRIYATPQCKHRGRAEQQTTTMKEAA